MTQEAVRMRPGEDDRADDRIAVCTIDQLFQLLGDLGIEQRVRASVDTSDKHPGVALDGNVSYGLRATSRRARHERHRPIRRHDELLSSLDYVRLTYVRNTICWEAM